MISFKKHQTHSHIKQESVPQLFLDRIQPMILKPLLNTKTPMLRDRRKNKTQHSRQYFKQKSTPLQPCDAALNYGAKPVSAKLKERSKLDCSNKVQQLNLNNQINLEEQFIFPTQRNNSIQFKKIKCKSNLYMKPFMKYKNKSTSLSQNKSDIYRQISNPNIDKLQNNQPKNKIIQYFTQYDLPQSTKQQQLSVNHGKSKLHRLSLNVLRNKLKRFTYFEEKQQKKELLYDFNINNA